MRLIIQNDLKRLYARFDHGLIQTTRLDGDSASGQKSLPVLNGNGIAADSFLMIGSPGEEQSEIGQVDSIASNTITLKANLVYTHDNKSPVFRLDYDQAKLYEDTTLLDTLTLTADGMVSYAHACSNDKTYRADLYNSATTTTLIGEDVDGDERLLCSMADVYAYESVDGTWPKMLEKLDIASREIYALFTRQGDDVGDLDDRDLLRQPCALLALHYYFHELAKNPDDLPTMKSRMYLDKYNSKIKEATDVINETDDEVKVFAQTRAIR